MMGEEKKIQVEEVDKVDTPPRARVTPETPSYSRPVSAAICAHSSARMCRAM